MATKENLLGMASTNTSPLVAPTRAQETVFGTNPIAVRHKVVQALNRFIILSLSFLFNLSNHFKEIFLRVLKRGSGNTMTMKCNF